MIKLNFSLVTFLIFFLSQFSYAQSSATNESSEWGLGIKIGSTGAGLELTKSISEKWNLRLGYSDLSYDYDVNDNNLNYETDISKSAGSLLLDWHPWGGSFRFSAGIYAHGDNEMDAIAIPTGGSFEINGNLYNTSSVSSVTGLIDMGSSAPYFGIGWGNAVKGSRISFLVELGLQFQNKPDIAMTINDCTLSAAICNTLITDLEAEVLEIRKDIDGFENWPVLNIGISYRF